MPGTLAGVLRERLIAATATLAFCVGLILSLRNKPRHTHNAARAGGLFASSTWRYIHPFARRGRVEARACGPRSALCVTKEAWLRDPRRRPGRRELRTWPDTEIDPMRETLEPTQDSDWVLSHEGYNVLTESAVECASHSAMDSWACAPPAR